ncbi:hypothetical protein SAY87_013927 [Trapa incisa]|uniref:Uncharacterized protein n=1 Tax=Trapa incisa TaxID=236973 RepID=A0AAN7KGF3_9MYRT|nr:hypothetical protein SAY87_013927 [Trapa incisa]
MTRQRDHCPSTCHRHPSSAPSVGFCPSCLCERLASVDPSAISRYVFPNPPIRPHRQLHRSRSYSAAASGGFDGVTANANDSRRKSCDSREQGAHADHFSCHRQLKDSAGDVRTRESGIGICKMSGEKFAPESHEFDGRAELRTMREFIDLERQRKKPTRKESAPFWDLSNKLRKWRRKLKMGNEHDLINAGGYGFRRRSSTMAPTVAPRVSLDYPGSSINSIDEPRVSLDGYLLGRTYKLTPLVSLLEDSKIIHSGLDCYGKLEAELHPSDSQKKDAVLELGAMNLESTAKSRVSLDGSEILYRAKLVITERELMEWNSNSKSKVDKEEEEEGIGGAVSVKPPLEDSHSYTLVPSVVEGHEPSQKPLRRWTIRGLMRLTRN